MFSVGIIGAGRIGGIRSEVIRQTGDSRVVAVADVNLEQARTIAAPWQAQVGSDWQSLVARDDIHIVVVATPTKFHREIALSALAAGKHVLCEKPLARTSAEAAEMVQAARRNSRILKTGFNYRHMAHVRKAKELLQAGAIGKILFIRSRYGHGGKPGYEKVWCTDRELAGGGVLIEQGIHLLDLVRYLMGEPQEVLGDIENVYWPFQGSEDNCFCMLRTGEGQVAQLHISWTQWINIFEFEIFGDGGYIRLNGRDGHYGPQTLVHGRKKADHSRPEEQLFQFEAPDSSWTLEWQEFLRAVRENKEPIGGAWDGLRAQELIDQIYESSSQRQWVATSAMCAAAKGI